MSHYTKCNFSTTDRDFFIKISGFIVEGVIFIASIFYSIFQNYAEEMDSHLLCVSQCFSKHALKTKILLVRLTSMGYKQSTNSTFMNKNYTICVPTMMVLL